MQLIHTFLNLVSPPATFFILLFFLPALQAFRFLLSWINYLFTENVAGKVVLITGASSGIGEHIAYEYAKRGAYLALAARRGDRLRIVAETAKEMGSPEVLSVVTDVSKPNDCKNFIDQTFNHFGRLDHVVNNAGMTHFSLLEEVEDITNLRSVMDINFWGTVYTTQFAIPYLRQTKGKIVVMSSATSWFPTPRMSIYNASKAAVSQLFETLRVELGSDVHITLVTPGFVESEMTQGKFIDKKKGKIIVDQMMRDVQVGVYPTEKVESCARTIVNSTLRRERYVTTPAWYGVTYYWKILCPEIIEWSARMLYITKPGESVEESLNKKILDFTGAKNVLYQDSLLDPQIGDYPSQMKAD
ncbi:11-beta-hydroxysteroid dehydrogenase A-like [Impatiens glandulifera]|uniref:11-beta-hydroxysteroid dehydrogenase A-like n=1 Tax=Impatiens glandulifera TaxID=253017 RepID=UPI001FB0C798|nr:11-beta-hydroxysteroid dehydrogenase A-like [Impatiens glandulifera]